MCLIITTTMITASRCVYACIFSCISKSFVSAFAMYCILMYAAGILHLCHCQVMVGLGPYSLVCWQCPLLCDIWSQGSCLVFNTPLLFLIRTKAPLPLLVMLCCLCVITCCCSVCKWLWEMVQPDKGSGSISRYMRLSRLSVLGSLFSVWELSRSGWLAVQH